MYKGYHIAGSLALFASTQLSSQKLDMTDKKFYKDIITLVEEWGQSLKRVTTSVTSPPTSTSTSISSSSIHTSHLTSNSTISIINPPNSLSLAESDQSAPTIPSSLITRASRKSKSPSTSSNPPSNSKPNLPASDPSKKYSHRYREFNTRLLTILEKYRTKTNSPGLTAAIHFNPESEKYIPSSTVFDIDYEEGESDRQGKLINTIIDVNKGCICGDITCSCSDNSDNLDNSSSTSLSSFSHCAPCTLSSLEKPIQTHGFIAWAGAVGLSDIELGVPIRSSTKMKVASISKVITAMLCARFVETGLLNVDTPITTYLNYDWDDISGRLFSDYKNEKIRSINPIGVHDQGVGMNPDAKSIPHSATFQHAASRPYTLTAMQKAVQSSSNSTFDSNSSSNLSSRIDIPRHFDTITTRQLLAHTSGVRGYLGDEFLSSLTYPTTASSLMPILQDDLLHPPGEKFSYTTHGYSFIASVLESIVKNAANSPHDSADNNAISNLSNTTPPTWYKDSQDRKVVKQGDSKYISQSTHDFPANSFVSIVYKYLLSPLQIKNTIPIPPSTIPVLDRSKQYTRELHTSLPSEVINTFESLSGIVNESEVAKYTLVRVNGNGIYHGNLQYITGTNPCGLPQPVYNSPFTDNSNKYAGAGFLANATDLALLGGALTGLDPAIKSNILDSFWTSQKVPRHAKKAKGEGIEIEMKNTGYGLGFTILPTGNVNVVKTISNNGNVDIVDTTVAAVTQNTQGQLIIDDVTTTTTSTTTKQGPWWYGRAVGHSGQAIDGSSYILIMPEEGITVSVLSNIDRCNLKPLAFEIAKEFEQFIQ